MIPTSGYQGPATDPFAAADPGYRATATDSGYRQAVTDSGYQRAVTSSGAQRPVTDSGPQWAVTDSGYQRAVTESGRQRAVTDSGHRRAATNSGYRRAVARGDASERTSSTDQQRALGGGSGYHRAVGKPKGRRVAAWPIAAAVLVLVVALGWLAWTWADGALNRRAEAEANKCAEGDVPMRVVVSPTAGPAITAAAQKWNANNTVVHSRCIRIQIDQRPSDQVFAALTGAAPLESIGGLPAGWIPESAQWTEKVNAAKPGVLGSTPESIAGPNSPQFPFLTLSGPGVDDVQARAAQTFRDFLKEPAQQSDLAAAGLKTGG